jgi:hypothetical protein
MGDRTESSTWSAGAVLAAALLLAAACTSAQAPAAAPVDEVDTIDKVAEFAEAPCPTPNVPGVPQLELGPEFRCGYLTVPEDRSVPDGRTIGIAVARVGAASPHPGRTRWSG